MEHQKTKFAKRLHACINTSIFCFCATKGHLRYRACWATKLLPAILMLHSVPCCSQRALSLREAILIAQKTSPYYHRAKNTYERSYWQFKNFNASFKPQIRFNATVPTFYRAINPITQPDGTIRFVRVAQANNAIGVGVRQNIGLTGGILSAGTSIQRTDNFSGNKSSYFLSTPIQLSYSQGSLLYNDFRWRKQLEPLLFEVSDKSYSENIEDAGLEAIKMFLGALSAQAALEIALANQANADTLYRLSKERYMLGTVPKTDLLQLELNMLRAQSESNENRIFHEGAVRGLKRILGLDQDASLTLQTPEMPDYVNVPYDKALEEARFNRSTVLKFRVQRLQADQEVAKAKGQNSIELSVLANLGTQQTAPTFIGSYQNLQNQQYIGLTLDLPIQDWGYRKSQIRLATANRELVEVNMEQEEIVFEQEIYLQVLQFSQRHGQLQIAMKADTVAQERLSIAKERYLLGKLSILDLNLALQESVNSKKGYVEALTGYWLSFYTLRRLTLFDFIDNKTLIYRRE